MFIYLEKNPDGSHAFQYGGTLQEGWAFWDVETVPTPDTFPFVNVEVEEVTHPAVVVKKNVEVDGEIVTKEIVLRPEFTQLEVVAATEGEEIVLPEPESEPTTEEILNAMLGVTE